MGLNTSVARILAVDLGRSRIRQLEMRKSVRIATLAEIQTHEQRVNANVRIGGYNMDKLCPTTEFQYFHMELESSDLARVFLLWERTFVSQTQGNSCKLVDITTTAESMAMQRRPTGEVNGVDLINCSGLEPVFVTDDLEYGPLVTIDGNHRLTAHYSRFRRIDNVKVFVGVHPSVLGWEFIPPLAKYMNNPTDRNSGSTAC